MSIFTDELNPNSEDIYNKGGGSAYYFLRVWVSSKFAEDEKSEQETNLFLSGTRWVVTGSFATFKPREKAAELIKKYGGEVLSSVSGKTTHLLCGEEAGSKLEKARSVGANIVDEQTFIKMIEENTASQEKKPDNVKKAEVQLELF